MKGKVFYAKCPLCKDYYEEAISLQDARDKVESHEKESHKGKQVSSFGVGVQNERK